jgi:hypothetical protein
MTHETADLLTIGIVMFMVAMQFAQSWTTTKLFRENALHRSRLSKATALLREATEHIPPGRLAAEIQAFQAIQHSEAETVQREVKP